jgi:putative (di)nucleoside polyphosphate hydrolase
MTELDFRPNVCLLILNSRDEIFIGERNGLSGYWQLPQGGIENGDSVEEAACRELCEETGIQLEYARLLGILPVTYSYEWSPEFFSRGWRGQRQRYAVFRFFGEDSRISLDAHVPVEFMNWRWCPLDALLDSVAEERREGYALALNSLSTRLPWE